MESTYLRFIKIIRIPACHPKFIVGGQAFNTATIRYSIPAKLNLTGLQDLSGLRVSLKIYDALGREVATLVNEEKPAGFYEVQFNASKLSSGIYFYRLTSGTYTGVKKFVLLR